MTVSDSAPSVNCETLLKFEGRISGQPAIILLDSGASWYYLASTFLQKHPLQVKPAITQAEIVELADGTTSKCQGIAEKVPVTIQNYRANPQTFNILKLGKYDAILGKS
jgi:hypothetical protein